MQATLLRVKTPEKSEAWQIFSFAIVVKCLDQKSLACIGFLTLKQISNAQSEFKNFILSLRLVAV